MLVDEVEDQLKVVTNYLKNFDFEELRESTSMELELEMFMLVSALDQIYNDFEEKIMALKQRMISKGKSGEYKELETLQKEINELLGRDTAGTAGQDVFAVIAKDLEISFSDDFEVNKKRFGIPDFDEKIQEISAQMQETFIDSEKKFKDYQDAESRIDHAPLANCVSSTGKCRSSYDFSVPTDLLDKITDEMKQISIPETLPAAVQTIMDG